MLRQVNGACVHKVARRLANIFIENESTVCGQFIVCQNHLSPLASG